MNAALSLLRCIVGLAHAGLVAHLALWCGPDVEVKVSPVLAEQVLTDVVRNEAAGEACFTWRFDKRRAARTLDANWTLRAEGRIWPYQAVRQAGDSLGDRPPGILIDRPVGPRQWTRKCITLPPALARRPFRITGFIKAIRQERALTTITAGDEAGRPDLLRSGASLADQGVFTQPRWEAGFRATAGTGRSRQWRSGSLWVHLNRTRRFVCEG